MNHHSGDVTQEREPQSPDTPHRSHLDDRVEDTDEHRSTPALLPVMPLRERMNRHLTLTPSIEHVYAGLPAETRDIVRSAAARIRERRQRQIEDIIAIGRDLLLVKERLGHGQFLAWLQVEVALSERSAQNHMRVAEEFEGKSATVADLPPTVVYKLAAKTVPPEVRQDILSQLEHDDRPSPAEIKQQIAAAQNQVREQKDQQRKAQHRAKTWAKMTPKERTTFEKQEQRRNREERRRVQQVEEVTRQRRARTDELLDILIERLGTEVSEVLTRIQEVGVYALLAQYPERTKVAPPGEELSAVDS
jgi:hypothetical protein